MTRRYPILNFSAFLILTISSLYAQDSTSEILSTEEAEEGDVGFGIAYLMPHGKSAEGANAGGQLFLRVVDRDMGIPTFSFWITASFSYFGAHWKTVSVEFRDIFSEHYIAEAERRAEDYMFSLYFGPQLGSTSRRATFRPRVGIGLGFNVFWTDYDFRGLDPRHEGDECLGNETGVVLVRGGWRFVAGVDVFNTDKAVSSSLGVSFGLTHERIWHRDFSDGCDRFWGFRFGIVVSFPVK